MKWEPWNQNKKDVAEALSLSEIGEPPCRCCKNFRPRLTTDEFGEQNGVVICSAPHMHHDFSCYEVRVEAVGD